MLHNFSSLLVVVRGIAITRQSLELLGTGLLLEWNRGGADEKW